MVTAPQSREQAAVYMKALCSLHIYHQFLAKFRTSVVARLRSKSYRSRREKIEIDFFSTKELVEVLQTQRHSKAKKECLLHTLQK